MYIVSLKKKQKTYSRPYRRKSIHSLTDIRRSTVHSNLKGTQPASYDEFGAFKIFE